MAPAGRLVVGRKGNADVAVVEDRIMLAVSLLDLGQGLRDQESAPAVSGHEGDAGLEEIQTTERRELVEPHQELVFAPMDAIPDELPGPPDLTHDTNGQRVA